MREVPRSLSPGEHVSDRAPGLTRVRALRAISWSSASTGGSALLNLFRAAVLTRLVLPDDFGLFGLALVAVIGVSHFTDLGVGASVLVERFDSSDEQRRFLDTFWTAQLGRAMGLTLVVLLTGTTYGTIMGDPRLGPLLVALAIWFILVALRNPGLLLKQRALDQRPLAQLKLITEGLGLLLTVGAASLWPGPWALAFGFLATAALDSAGSYVVSAWRPRLAFDRALFRRGIRLGKYATLVVALAFVTTQVDNAIVGRILGPAVLGLYLFAYRVASLPIDALQSVLGGVMMPAYAELQDRGVRVVGSQFARVLSIATASLCTLSVPAVLLRGEIVTIVGGERWLAAQPLIPPLLLLALLRGTMIQFGTFLSGMGRLDLDARCKVVEALLFVPACVAGVYAMGATGAAWAGVVSYALGLGLRAVAASRILSVPVGQMLRPWLRVVLLALGCVAFGAALEGEGVSRVLVAPAMTAALVGAIMYLDGGLRLEIRRLSLGLR
jgi:O-antigen/teichoic acid export membrane protein